MKYTSDCSKRSKSVTKWLFLTRITESSQINGRRSAWTISQTAPNAGYVAGNPAQWLGWRRWRSTSVEGRTAITVMSSVIGGKAGDGRNSTGNIGWCWRWRCEQGPTNGSELRSPRIGIAQQEHSEGESVVGDGNDCRQRPELVEKVETPAVTKSGDSDSDYNRWRSGGNRQTLPLRI